MSPDPHLIILDGKDHEDIDFQTDLSVIQGIPFYLVVSMNANHIIL